MLHLATESDAKRAVAALLTITENVDANDADRVNAAQAVLYAANPIWQPGDHGDHAEPDVTEPEAD